MTNPAQSTRFDVAVLGGGPGGYPAAIVAAQAGGSVALIEQGPLGGTCLNRGCIPTKALIANAELLTRIQSADAFGIQVGHVSFDYSQMNQRKETIVAKMRRGVESLIAANQITLFRGTGKFLNAHEIAINGQDRALIEAKNVIIATGSEPREMKMFPFDGQRIHSSTSILELSQLPTSLAIIGGGVIGCEFASLYAALGVKVTILELLGSLLPLQPPAVGKTLTAAFERRDMTVKTGVVVERIEKSPFGVHVLLANGDRIAADLALVAVGRTRNTHSIGLEKAGVSLTDSGEILTNDKMETCVPGVYAVGDVTTNWWLAHVATHQGMVAARNCVGQPSRMFYNAVPNIIFTDPEIGAVGMSFEQAKEAGYQAVVGTYPFAALGKSQAAGHTEGFAEIIADSATGQILGAQVVGYEAATLIAEMGVAITNELTLESLIETIHGHPTIAEAWLEAALVAHGTPLHLPPRTKRDPAHV